MYLLYYMSGNDNMLDLDYESDSNTELKQSDKQLLQYVINYILQLMK